MLLLPQLAFFFKSASCCVTGQHCHFKLKFRNIQRYTPIALYPTAPLYNIIIIFDKVLRQHHQGFASARLTCQAYVGGKKRESAFFGDHAAFGYIENLT